MPNPDAGPSPTAAAKAPNEDALSVLDRRTGKSYEIPIEDGAIRAIDLRQIKVNEDDFGLMSYDAAFLNTASCTQPTSPTSTETRGSSGIGATRSSSSPRPAPTSRWPTSCSTGSSRRRRSTRNGSTRSRTTPCSTSPSRSSWTVSTTTPTPWGCSSRPSRGCPPSTRTRATSTIPSRAGKQTHRLIAKMPTLAAFAYRHSLGQPYVYPDNDLSYTENFLNMLFKLPATSYEPHPVLVEAPSTCSSSSTRTTSRTAEPTRCGASAPPTRTPTRRSPAPRRRSTARSTAAPTRKS